MKTSARVYTRIFGHRRIIPHRATLFNAKEATLLARHVGTVHFVGFRVQKSPIVNNHLRIVRYDKLVITLCERPAIHDKDLCRATHCKACPIGAQSTARANHPNTVRDGIAEKPHRKPLGNDKTTPLPDIRNRAIRVMRRKSRAGIHHAKQSHGSLSVVNEDFAIGPSGMIVHADSPISGRNVNMIIAGSTGSSVQIPVGRSSPVVVRTFTRPGNIHRERTACKEGERDGRKQGEAPARREMHISHCAHPLKNAIFVKFHHVHSLLFIAVFRNSGTAVPAFRNVLYNNRSRKTQLVKQVFCIGCAVTKALRRSQQDAGSLSRTKDRPARRDGHRPGTEIGNRVVQRRLHLGREPEPVVPLLHIGAVSR